VRRPNYVSPSSANLIVTVNGGAPATYGLTTQSPGCAMQNGKQTCSFSVAAPAGVDALALSVTDGAGNVLSHNVVTATIAAGVATPVALTLNGVPASVAIVPGTGAKIDGTSAPYHFPGLFPQPVEVEPLDADGNDQRSDDPGGERLRDDRVGEHLGPRGVRAQADRRRRRSDRHDQRYGEPAQQRYAPAVRHGDDQLHLHARALHRDRTVRHGL
jgi:hypothetical protein